MLISSARRVSQAVSAASPSSLSGKAALSRISLSSRVSGPRHSSASSRGGGASCPSSPFSRTGRTKKRAWPQLPYQLLPFSQNNRVGI